MTLAQRMIVMNGGVMEQFGTPEEVYTRPATTFVASFMVTSHEPVQGRAWCQGGHHHWHSARASGHHA